MQDACHENDCCFFGCFQGVQGWRGVCLRLQLRFGNGSGGAIVTGAAGQRLLATALCGHSYCSFDWAVFLCSANFVRTAGELNEMARRMWACRAWQGCTALLSGNIGEKCSVGGFFPWCARRTLPQVEPCCWGLLPFCKPISQPHGCTVAVLPVPVRQTEGRCLKPEKSAGRIERVGALCAPFFSTPSNAQPAPIPISCRPGTSGKRAASEDFSLVRTAHPTAGGAMLPGVAAFSYVHFATAWVMRQVTEGVIARMAGSCRRGLALVRGLRMHCTAQSPGGPGSCRGRGISFCRSPAPRAMKGMVPWCLGWCTRCPASPD